MRGMRGILMSAFLDQNIKDIITKYPAVVPILDAYQIGCTACNAGSCRTRDIVSVHNLSEDDEHTLLTKIAAVIYPGLTIDIPRIPRADTSKKELAPPLKALVAEHVHIMKVVAAIPELAAALPARYTDQKPVAEKAVDFIVNYADRFHHAKEEDLLFREFDASLDIIAVMKSEHETGRAYVRSAREGLKEDNVSRICENLSAYGVLLAEHIRKEDEILYPWMNRLLSDSRVGFLFSKFAEIDGSFGAQAGSYISFAQSLENK